MTNPFIENNGHPDGVSVALVPHPVAVPVVRLAHGAAALHSERGVLTQVASSATSNVLLAPQTLINHLSLLQQERINPIVNISFTMGFIGAGGRARTGTVLPPVDFESTSSTNSNTPAFTTGSI